MSLRDMLRDCAGRGAGQVSASKHTPGAWRVGDAGYTVFGPKKPDGGMPETIATVRSRANSALIAAAPDMLEALRGARRAFQRVGCAAGDELKLDAVEAAIARAEGRATK